MRALSEDGECCCVTRCAARTANLTIDDASLEEIMAAGCAPRVLTAMTTHPSSARVQQDAAGVLSNITLREVHRAVVASWGAVKVVLTSLTTHIDDVEVLWRGVGVLLNLSLSFSLRPGILAEGTVPIVLKCQLAFESDERLQWRALGGCAEECMCVHACARVDEWFVCGCRSGELRACGMLPQAPCSILR